MRNQSISLGEVLSSRFKANRSLFSPDGVAAAVLGTACYGDRKFEDFIRGFGKHWRRG